MPNYNLVTTARYKPFTFDELLKPALMATQAHRELEDKYDTLAANAANIGSLINPELDKDLYNQYTNYNNALTDLSGVLSKEGITPASRQAARDIFNRYNAEVRPIEQAYNRRLQEIERQDKAFDAAKGRIVFSRDARTTPLQAYYNGETPVYSQVNLDDITATGISGGKALSSRYIKTEEGQRFKNDYLSLVTETGLSPEEALKVLGNSDEYPEFQRFRQDVLNNYKTGDFSIPDQKRIETALDEGINLGIGYDRKENLHDNWRDKARLSADLQDRNAERAFTRQKDWEREKMGMAQRQKEEEEMGALFAPRVSHGAEGKTSEDVVRARDTRKIVVQIMDNGKPKNISYPSTAKLDALQEDLNSKKAEFDDITNNLERDIKDYEEEYTRRKTSLNTAGVRGDKGYASLGASMNAGSQSTGLKDYYKYSRAREAYEKAQSAVENEKKWINDKINQYSWLSNDAYEAFRQGMALEEAQSAQQTYTYGLNLSKSQYGEVKESLSRLMGLPGAKLTLGNKTITGDKAADILKDDKSVIGVTSDKNGNYLSVTRDNKRYRIEASDQISDFNRKLTELNEAMGTFNSISNDNIEYAGRPIESNKDLQNLINIAIAENKFKDYGKYKAVTIVIPSSNPEVKVNEAIRVVIDKSTNQIHINTVSDELNGGRNREEQTGDIARAGLQGLLRSLAHTAEAKEEEK